MRFRLFMLTLFALTATLAAQANITPPDNNAETAKKADLVGGVYSNDTKKPLGNVTITATHLSTKKEKVVLTDAEGNYSFNDLETGVYKFVFNKNGYKKLVKDKVQIRQEEGFQLDIGLTPHSTYDFLPGPFSFSDLE
jgi:hypothetical protein